MNHELTHNVTEYAHSLGADLVGIAPVSRWSKAPIEHSPQGVFPGAKSVIVCAVHFLDANTELGSEPDLRVPGPALSEMNAGSSLQLIGFRVAKFLQDGGCGAMFVRQTGMWRYRSAGEDRGWIGDICHYYAAALAGLGEVGWSNITLTPEFGPRQRFMSIITDAELVPTPLYDGSPLCDRCMMCAKHCPTKSFDKDVSGKILCIECEDKKWEFPERNLWRCALGENFQMDVFLKQWDDHEITEELVCEITEKAVKEHPEWIKGWKMGMCLKYCVPPERRYWDRDYCKSPRRKRDVQPDESQENLDKMVAELQQRAGDLGVDILAAAPDEELARLGLDIRQNFPDAKSALVIGLDYPENCPLSTNVCAGLAELQLGVHIQEKYGFSAMVRPGLNVETVAIASGALEEGLAPNNRRQWNAIVTSAPLKKLCVTTTRIPARIGDDQASLAKQIRRIAKDEGADLVGISPAKRLESAADSIGEAFESHEDYFIVEDKSWLIRDKSPFGTQAMPFEPQARSVKLQPKKPSDYLPGAKSIIVIGLGLLDASVDNVGTPPAYKAGHYHTSVHEEVFNQLITIQLRIARFLDAQGIGVATAIDLCGLASMVGRRSFDLTASRFAAVAAGLGEIGWNGLVLTPQFGARQRFACLIVDAQLPGDEVYSGPKLCKNCRECVSSCPMAAIDDEDFCSVQIGGQTFQWGRQDRLRCDLAKRYGLVPEAGGKYIGCQNNFTPPRQITPDFVCQAIRDADRVQRPTYTPTVERCFTQCRAHQR